MVRISFSTLFKEFKSTATWLQFPFLCGAAKGPARDGTARRGEELCVVLLLLLAGLAHPHRNKLLERKLSSEVDWMLSRRVKGGGPEQETLSS